MIEINRYNYVKIEEYNGMYSLILGYKDKDGEFKPKWCKMEFGKGNERNVPVKIPLGNRDQAGEVLSKLIDSLVF